MYRLNLEKGVRANIWLNEELAAGGCDGSKVIMEENTVLLADSKKIIIELFIPRSHNNYALLGVDFSAHRNGKCTVRQGIRRLNCEKHNDAIALSIDSVIWGITEDVESGIMLSLDKHRKENALPSGILTYDISAYGEIGSSADMFRRVSDILLSLLVCDEISEAFIIKIIQDHLR